MGSCGSNTNNYATVTVVPSSQIGIVVLTNIGVSADNTNARTVAAEREAFAVLVDIVQRRLAAQSAAASTTVAPTATPTTAAASPGANAAVPATSQAPKKKVCSISKTTRKRVCR